MSIDKNFVVKNGLEVNNNLILADATTKKVGIASLTPQYTLDVAGGIGATHSYITGFSTVSGEFNIGIGGTVLTGVGGSIGIGTITPAFLLDVRTPVSTGRTAVFARGDVYVTGDITANNLLFNEANLNKLYVANAIDLSGSLLVSGITTLSGRTNLTNSLEVSGISTFSNFVDVNNSVDILNDLRVTGISTLTTLGVTGTSTARNSIVTGVATISTLGVTGTSTAANLRVTGVSTLGRVQISDGIVSASSGIVTYYGDGQYLNLSSNPSSGIGIGTTGGVVGYGITFLDLRGTGVSTSFYNSNVGIATIFFEGGGSGTIGIGTVFPTTFAGNGDLFYNINYGRIFVYYDEVALGIGSTAVWVDAAPFNIGFVDIQDLSLETLTITSPAGVVKAGIGSTALIVEGNTRITGVVTATTFIGNLTGTATNATYATYAAAAGVSTYATTSGVSTYATTAGISTVAQGLTGTPNINVGTIVGTSATFTNLTVNGTQTVINTTSLEIADKTVGIGSTSSPSDSLADGAGIVVYGTTNKSLTYNNTKKSFETNIPFSPNEIRVVTGAEKVFRTTGNTLNLSYNSSSANIAYTTNPSGDVTLNVTNIPTSSDFDDYSITFAVVVNSTGTARTCTAVSLNGVSRPIRWIGGSLSAAISGVTTTTGHTIFSFTGINTVGSASTTTNYEIFGSVSGGFW